MYIFNKKENYASTDGMNRDGAEESILLRPHHGMCLAYFKGKGYSNRFSAHMQEMLELFQKGAKIKLYVDTDAICAACPNNVCARCVEHSLVERYDRAVLKLCQFSEGEEMSFAQFVNRVETQILSCGKRQEICKGCKWDYICRSEKSRWAR